MDMCEAQGGLPWASGLLGNGRALHREGFQSPVQGPVQGTTCLHVGLRLHGLSSFSPLGDVNLILDEVEEFLSGTRHIT